MVQQIELGSVFIGSRRQTREYYFIQLRNTIKVIFNNSTFSFCRIFSLPKHTYRITSSEAPCNVTEIMRLNTKRKNVLKQRICT